MASDVPLHQIILGPAPECVARFSLCAKGGGQLGFVEMVLVNKAS